jgi:hypothetical protein
VSGLSSLYLLQLTRLLEAASGAWALRWFSWSSLDIETIGALANNIWSFAGNKDRQSMNSYYTQWLVTYNIGKGWYVNTAPSVTANWNAPKGAEQWIVPMGMGLGRVSKLVRQPVNAQAGLYYNVVRPEDCAHWQVRWQIALLYPKAKPR